MTIKGHELTSGFKRPSVGHVSTETRQLDMGNGMMGTDQPDARDWRAFQKEVAALFTETRGWSTRVNHPVRGSRIGVVHVDVLATYRPPRERTESFSPRGQDRAHGFAFIVIVECKFWKTPVPQEKLFALKTVVEDVGASLGILVSEVGVQRGAIEYLAHPVNIVALTFDQLKAVASGSLYANCTTCGKTEIFPFVVDPFPSAPEQQKRYCRECYRKMRGFRETKRF